MNSRLLYGILLILIIISSVVYSEEPKTTSGVETKSGTPDCDTQVSEGINPEASKLPPKGAEGIVCDEIKKPVEVGSPNNLIGRIPSPESYNFGPDGLTTNRIVTDTGEFRNVENLRTENNNIIADYLEFTASSPSEFSVLNPIDNTKINFNIPEGGSVKLINKDGVFETITSENVEEEIISKCIGPITYTSEEKQSTLTIQRSLDRFNTIYTISNAAMQHEANGKKQIVRSKTLPTEVEIDSECLGIVCAELGIDASLDYEDSMFNSFYLEFPEVGQIEQNYNFCFDKQEGDGYKIQNSFVLDKAIKLFNYKKELVYQGFDSSNKALFKTEAGIIKGFKIKNLNPEKQLIAKLYPSKSFIIIEEKEDSYLTLLDQLPDYTAIESYESELSSSSPDFWIASDILYQEGEKGNLGTAYPPENKELERLLNKGSIMLDEVKEALKRWNNKELLEQL